jgi:hypothetical protein
LVRGRTGVGASYRHRVSAPLNIHGSLDLP